MNLLYMFFRDVLKVIMCIFAQDTLSFKIIVCFFVNITIWFSLVFTQVRAANRQLFQQEITQACYESTCTTGHAVYNERYVK